MISRRMSSRYSAYGMLLALEHLAELVGRQLVLLRDAQDRALDHRVVDADARFLGELQQRALGDQALQHLLVEHVGGRRRARSTPSSARARSRCCSSTSYCVIASSLTTATTRSSGHGRCGARRGRRRRGRRAAARRRREAPCARARARQRERERMRDRTTEDHRTTASTRAHRDARLELGQRIEPRSRRRSDGSLVRR